MGNFGSLWEKMENFGHFLSKMVDFGLLACLKKYLPLKITLIGEYWSRKSPRRAEQHGHKLLFLLHFGPFAAFPPHKQACAKQYNHTKEK
jgi:hypothetical protein